MNLEAVLEAGRDMLQRTGRQAGDRISAGGRSGTTVEALKAFYSTSYFVNNEMNW